MGIKLRGCHQAGGLCLGLIIIYYCAPVIFHCKAAVCNCELLFVIASLRSRFVIASLRSNLSFRCPPALDNRDRHVPRDDRIACEAISSFLFAYDERRDRHVPRDDRIACEAISLFAVRQPCTTEIATFLAMTGTESTGEIASCLAMTELPAKQSLFSLSASPGRPRSPRSSR